MTEVKKVLSLDEGKEFEPEKVRFRISGQQFDIPFRVLLDWKDTMLYSSANFILSSKILEEGIPVIDYARNATMFAVLHTYMTSGELVIPTSQTERELLRIEAAYYGLTKVVSIIESGGRVDSKPCDTMYDEKEKPIRQSLKQIWIPGTDRGALDVTDREIRDQEHSVRAALAQDDEKMHTVALNTLQTVVIFDEKESMKITQTETKYSRLVYPDTHIHPKDIKLVNDIKDFKDQFAFFTSGALPSDLIKSLPIVVAGGAVLASMHTMPSMTGYEAISNFLDRAVKSKPFEWFQTRETSKNKESKHIQDAQPVAHSEPHEEYYSHNSMTWFKHMFVEDELFRNMFWTDEMKAIAYNSGNLHNKDGDELLQAQAHFCWMRYGRTEEGAQIKKFVRHEYERWKEEKKGDVKFPEHSEIIDNPEVYFEIKEDNKGDSKGKTSEHLTIWEHFERKFTSDAKYQSEILVSVAGSYVPIETDTMLERASYCWYNLSMMDFAKLVFEYDGRSISVDDRNQPKISPLENYDQSSRQPKIVTKATSEKKSHRMVKWSPNSSDVTEMVVRNTWNVLRKHDTNFSIIVNQAGRDRLNRCLFVHNKYIKTNGTVSDRPASSFYFRSGWKSWKKTQAARVLVVHESFRKTDIDIFLTTRDPSEALKTIQKLYQHFKELYGKFTVVRTAHSVTFNLPYRHVQIITRLYHSAEHVILGFDLDCCCVAYDGRRVITLPRGLRALETRVNLVDPTRQSMNFEDRLAKYAKRGFAIGVPGLDVKEQYEKTLKKLDLIKEGQYIGLVGSHHLLGLLHAIHGDKDARKIFKIKESDYCLLDNLERKIRRGIVDGNVSKLSFVCGTDINKVLLSNKYEVAESKRVPYPPFSIQETVEKSAAISPEVAFQIRAPHVQDRADTLFTGSFNPISADWYNGNA